MSRRRAKRALFSHLVFLLSVPLLLSGTAYALMSQNLTIDATTSSPVYVATEYLFLTYTKTITNVSGLKNYSIPMTIRNNGPISVTAWQIVVDLPADTTTYTCPTSVSCTRSGQTLTIKNGGANGTINRNATRSFTISFRTTDPYYTLQNVYVSGAYASGYQTVTGLTVARTQGARSRVNNRYQWPITFTITNSSGFTLSAWQVTVPWTTARSVVSLPPDVTYVVNGSSLLITSTQPIANNEVYVVSGVFSSTASSWTIGATIRGMP